LNCSSLWHIYKTELKVVQSCCIFLQAMTINNLPTVQALLLLTGSPTQTSSSPTLGHPISSILTKNNPLAQHGTSFYENSN
jgi:hypothetical protein